MKRILYILIISFFTLFVTTHLSAQNAMQSISIRFFDKTIYYPGNDVDNPVYVRFTISNTGSDSMRFKLAEDRVFSVDFVAYNVKNIQLPHTQSFIRKRSSNQPVFFREITLESGEEYSFVENVKEYVAITEPGLYYIEAWFYPELNRSTQSAGSMKTANDSNIEATPLVSNRLTLEVRPSPSAAVLELIPLHPTTQDILIPQSLPPDKVVEHTIISRQKGLWDQYFLYIDVEEMLMRDRTRNVKYRSESADGRIRMLENYKMDLRQARIDKDIVAIPEKFQVEKTTYTANEGTVTVLEWFKYDTYYEKKRYTYYLRQRDGIWKIYDYHVENLGTE